MSILRPMLGRPWLRRRNARLLSDTARPIDKAGYIQAGGTDHFVTIRGASRDNPVSQSPRRCGGSRAFLK